MGRENSGVGYFFLLVNFFVLPLAQASVLDPMPVPNPVGSPGGRYETARTTLFLCPQTKHFGNHDEKVVVETLMMEALGEGYRGMTAVGEVIRARMRLFSKNAEEVCLMPKQFSCWNDPAHEAEFMEKYKRYYFVALCAWMNSEETDLTGGATDYHADYVHPYWADAYRETVELGRHIFYSRQAEV